MEAEQNPVVTRLRTWDAEVVADVQAFRGELTVVIPRGHLRRVAEYLRAESGLEFAMLSDISVVDRFPNEPRFELNYHLLSLSGRERLRLRMHVRSDDAVVESLTLVWPTANWHEREIFDLFGVRFEDHPDLRRILMPEEWEGYPLRKDYPVEGYR